MKARVSAHRSALVHEPARRLRKSGGFAQGLAAALAGNGKADVLTVGTAGKSEAPFRGERAHRRLGHAAEGETDHFQHFPGQAVEKVTLVLDGIGAAQKGGAAGTFVNDGVVPRPQFVGSRLCCEVQQFGKFETPVALAAGVRRAARGVFLCGGQQDAFFELPLPVEHAKFDPQLRDDFVEDRGLLRGRFAHAERYSDDLAARFFCHDGGGGGIDSAGHCYDCAFLHGV